MHNWNVRSADEYNIPNLKKKSSQKSIFYKGMKLLKYFKKSPKDGWGDLKTQIDKS